MPLKEVRNILICFLLLLSHQAMNTTICASENIGSNHKYFTSDEVKMPSGAYLQKHVINSPPRPPVGAIRPTIARKQVNQTSGATIIDDVPAFTWCFGCSATSAAMIAGYYDRSGYPNLYSGPTNNGLLPLNNDEYWTTWKDSCLDTRNRAPVSATQKELDEQADRGHVDDYWVCYGDSGEDPFVTNGWNEHTHGSCTADFMGTSQSSSPIENPDGATTFWHYRNGDKLKSEVLFSSGPEYYKPSGLCGVQEFYESRGYTVNDAYNQYIYPYGTNDHGFTFEQYKREIDANRPVMIHVKGHTMVGVGYDDSASQQMYIYDTWDHSTHTMTWGGTYSDMQHYAVTIVTLESSGCTFSISPTDMSFGSEGGSHDVIIEASSSSSSWSVSESLPWVSASPSSGTGDGTVTVTVEANTGSSRSGTVTIAGQQFTVSQGGTGCSFAILPMSGSFGATGGSQEVSIDASGEDCFWTVSESLSWVSVEPTEGSGDGTVSVTVEKNSGYSRNGTVSIAGNHFTFSQDGSGIFTISPTNRDFGSGGGTQEVRIDAPFIFFGNGEWTVSESLSWVSVDPSDGTGDGSVTVTVQANTGPSRSGIISIADEPFALGQEGAACSFSISPSNESFDSSGGSREVSVEASNSGCSWSASESLSWVSLSPSNGTGDGSVTVTVESSSGSNRSGAVSIAGKAFEVAQNSNHPPEIGPAPSGPSSGKVGNSYVFSISGTDPDGDTLMYRYDWNETVSSWGGSSQSHSWNSPGTYAVSAQARDEHGATSDWSSTFQIKITEPEEKNKVFPWLQLLLGE